MLRRAFRCVPGMLTTDDSTITIMGSSPRLRTDLIVRQQQTADGAVFIVKDPVSEQFFRFRDAEQFIAEQLDGETPLEAVRQRIEEKFGATLPAAILDAFIRKLDKSGLLEAQNSAKPTRADRQARFRGSLLYLRFKIFDPARLFDRLGPRVRFLFTPYFVVLSGAIILLAVGTTIAHWGAYAQDLPRLYRYSTIPLFLTLTFLVVSAHEFAHGLTCRRFGGEVREIGFMLIYFQPAFYCNVSDAWLFPEKSHRLWVGLAGPYFELFLWALATLTWRATDAETSINHLALIVVTASGIKTLLNFNPLLKLDGYYLLSDYLDVPNLRRKSFRYVGDFIQRLFGGGTPTATPPSPRERRIYLTYGIAATVFSFAFMGYALLTVSDFLIVNGQPVALALFAGVVGARVRHRVRGLLGGLSHRSDPVHDGEDLETSDSRSPEPIEPTKKRRMSRRWTRRLVWTALTAAMLALLFLGRLELRISGPFNVRPIDNADIRAAVEGIVEEIYVDEGEQVTAGEPIARLSDKDLRAESLKTAAEIREARAKLDLLEAGPTAQEIEVAKRAIVKAEDQLTYARNRLTRSDALFEKGLLSRKEFEDHQELAATSDNTLAEARARLDALLSSIRPEPIAAMKAQIESLDAHRRYIEEQLQLPMVISPVNGVVATPSRELKELHGRLIKKGDLIAEVYDFKTVMAHIPISEKEIADVQVGQPVVLRARAYPNVDFHGRVTSIATVAKASSGGGQTPAGPSFSASSDGERKTILVTTQIENQTLLLKPEMTGQAKIYCGQQRILDLIGRRMARTVKVEFWSWW